MKLKTITILLAGIAFFTACLKDQELTEKEILKGETMFDALPDDFEAGWIRVKFNQLDDTLNTMLKRGGIVHTGIEALDKVTSITGATQMKRVFSDGGKFEERRRKYGLHLWYDFYVGEEEPLTSTINNFHELPFVEVVELIPLFRQNSTPKMSTPTFPDVFSGTFFNPADLQDPLPASGHLKSTARILNFNDPLLPRQWHYHNDGSTPSSIAGADANIFPAWEVSTGDPRVIVAVVDGGIDFSHPDFARNMWVNSGEIPGNGIDDDNNGYVDDIYGFRWGRAGVGDPTGEIFPMDHGSHCAGIIAAVSNNGVGIAGIAGGNGKQGTGARLMSCQTYVPDPAYPDDPQGNSRSTSQTPDAFAYAADNGAVIASCSFSYSGTTLSAAYKAGIDYFVDNAGLDEKGVQRGPMKGGLMVASAGNDGEVTTKYPASYEKVISVAYCMSNFKKSSSSNYGPSIDVTAPGGATSSSYAPDRVGGVFSTIPMISSNYNVEPGYSYKSGSSMAAPHVAGIAALILSAAVENGIEMTATKLRNIIELSCRNIDQYNPEYKGMLGHGLVDAGVAMRLLLGGDDTKVNPPEKVETTAGKNNINVSWEIPADYLGLPVVAIETYISLRPLENVDFENIPSYVKKETLENKGGVGQRMEKSFSNLDQNSEYFFALIAVDRLNQKSEPLFFSAKTKQEEITPEGGKIFAVYPTKVTEEFFISFPEVSFGKKVEIELHNSVGYKVYKLEKMGSEVREKVNVSQLAGGVYTVTLIFSGNREKHTIIKY